MYITGWNFLFWQSWRYSTCKIRSFSGFRYVFLCWCQAVHRRIIRIWFYRHLFWLEICRSFIAVVFVNSWLKRTFLVISFFYLLSFTVNPGFFTFNKFSTPILHCIRENSFFLYFGMERALLISRLLWNCLKFVQFSCVISLKKSIQIRVWLLQIWWLFELQ